jgi:hypothetical protein
VIKRIFEGLLGKAKTGGKPGFSFFGKEWVV